MADLPPSQDLPDSSQNLPELGADLRLRNARADAWITTFMSETDDDRRAMVDSLLSSRTRKPDQGDDIRPYLRAVEAIDWGKVQTQHNEEHYADWYLVDNEVLMYAGAAEDKTIEFLQRAPAAIRKLMRDLAEAEAELASAQARIDRVRQLADDLTLEDHPSHDHLCPDDVRKDILAVLDHPDATPS